jgi:superfamily II DNA helicase RecQ
MLINMSDIMADVIESCLQSFPQVSSLKPKQKIAVQCLLDGKDVIAILPTGFGKSLIYQLYVLVKVRYGGCHSSSILVVSPLKSIIEEQVNGLQEVSISATELNMEEKSLKEIFKYQVIFASAENCLSSAFQQLLKKEGKLLISLIVINKSHTVDTW